MSQELETPQQEPSPAPSLASTLSYNSHQGPQEDTLPFEPTHGEYSDDDLSYQGPDLQQESSEYEGDAYSYNSDSPPYHTDDTRLFTEPLWGGNTPACCPLLLELGMPALYVQRKHTWGSVNDYKPIVAKATPDAT